MCGRYYIEEADAVEEIARIIGQIQENERKQGASVDVALGEMRPGDMAPVVCSQGSRRMRWGFARSDGKGLLINARVETAATKPTFAACLRERRLVVPAGGYYEWQKKEDNTKQQFAFSRDGELLYMAGLWRIEPDGQHTFVILTTEASPSVREIHDRMPVLLRRDQLRSWLRDDHAVADILRDVQMRVRVDMV